MDLKKGLPRRTLISPEKTKELNAMVQSSQRKDKTVTFKKIFTLAFTVFTLFCEENAFNIGKYDVLHGGPAHTFIGLLFVVGLPVIDIFLIYISFFKKEQKEPTTIKEETEIFDNTAESGENRKRIYIKRLNGLKDRKWFEKDIFSSVDQIERLEGKLNSVREICSSTTGESKLDANKCDSILKDTIKVFYSNVENLLTRIEMFDVDEYTKFRAGDLELKSNDHIREKASLFDKTFKTVDGITDDNEEIILRVHTLLESLVELGSSKKWDNETILSMKHLNEYINMTEHSVKLDAEIGSNFVSSISPVEFNSSDDQPTLRL